MNLRDQLRDQLNKARPQRYNEQERDWVDEVADSFELDREELRTAARDYVRNLARDVEGKATQAGNSLMREFYRTGQLPLDWQLTGHLPISVENTITVNGQVKTVKERVKLSAATAKDFELWAEAEDRARNRDFAARGEAVQGAQMIAAQMRATGALTFAVWAREFAPVENSAA